MAERPILFSAPMVRAILSGTKTQTRRVVKCSLPISAVGSATDWERLKAHQQMTTPDIVLLTEGSRPFSILCPYGRPGDRLWVREAWRAVAAADAMPPRDLTPAHRIWYEAQEEVPFHPSEVGKLRPSMFMPRWASRITLEVTGVRVERLQDISEEDAIAEGIESESNGWRHYIDPVRFSCGSPRGSYQTLWESINGPESWDANPWVWVVSFRRP